MTVGLWIRFAAYCLLAAAAVVLLGHVVPWPDWTWFERTWIYFPFAAVGAGWAFAAHVRRRAGDGSGHSGP